MNFERLALEWEALVLPADAEHLSTSHDGRGEGEDQDGGERDGGEDVLHEVSPGVTA